MVNWCQLSNTSCVIQKNIIEKIIYFLLIAYAAVATISISASNIVISLALVLAIIHYAKYPTTNLGIDKGLLKAILFFLFAMFVSAVFAYNPALGFPEIGHTAYRTAPLFLASSFIKDKRQLWIILLVLIAAFTVNNFYAIWLGVNGNLRASGIRGGPMILAGYLVQLIPLIFILFINNICNTKDRRFLGLAIFIAFLALLFNGTRGAWIAVAAVLFAYAILQVRRNTKLSLVALLFLIVLIISLFSNQMFYDRVKTITDITFQSNSERLLMWQSAWHMFLDHPLTGVGTGNYGDLYQIKYISPQAQEPFQRHAHNNFFQVLAEYGLIGFIAFSYMFGYILFNAYVKLRDNQNNIWALAAILVTLGLLVQGLTEYNFGHSVIMRLYWFLLGLFYAAGRIYGTYL
ncbi:O-antigen ligase family protein [Thermosinus carboxydivorans]|nr:O-antigen ligase family protein [Thermosinus carboxydivorans]